MEGDFQICISVTLRSIYITFFLLIIFLIIYLSDYTTISHIL